MHTVNLSSPVHNYGDVKEAWNSFKREQDPSSISVRDYEEVLSDLPDQALKRKTLKPTPPYEIRGTLSSKADGSGAAAEVRLSNFILQTYSSHQNPRGLELCNSKDSVGCKSQQLSSLDGTDLIRTKFSTQITRDSILRACRPCPVR